MKSIENSWSNEEQKRFAIEEGQDLLTWASSQTRSRDTIEQEVTADGIIDRYQVADDEESANYSNKKPLDDADVNHQHQKPLTLVIGIKASVLHGFPFRQSIRSIWASRTSLLNQGVKVYFIGCQPVLFDNNDEYNSSQREALTRAIEMKKQVYGDLLTDELECEDSYSTLPTKVKELLHFAVMKHPQVPYVMVADGDIYLRVDHLVRALRAHGSTSKFYGGQVYSRGSVTPLASVRDPIQKLYLPESVYPMRELPPFVAGPYYLLSVDCAKYIAENRHLLGNLSALDDVSVALWFLVLQVHPENEPSFHHLRGSPCSEELVSFANLALHAIRLIRSNLQVSAPFCRGFDIATWLKPDREYGRLNAVPKVNVVADAEVNSGVLHVVTEATLEHRVTTRSFQYSPSQDEFKAHTAEVCDAILRTLDQLTEEKRVDPALLVLWRHNLKFALRSPAEAPRTVTIVCSPNSFASKVNLGCLFASIYTQNPIQVMSEAAFQERWRWTKIPDVFVFAGGNDGCWEGRDDLCQQLVTNAIQLYGKSSQLIMVTGEPWGINGLDESLLLISTVSQNPRKKHVYIPMASLGFSATTQSPLLLLESDHMERLSFRAKAERTSPSSSRKFCAYLYARCDQLLREYIYDLLNVMEPVDTLGMSVFQEAIDIYTQYKFVIAFENAQRPGYVTEKLVNAFLAGSIPIYLGHSDTVSQLFNPKSFIDCGRFATLRECALRVMEVHRSVELYESMLREPVVGNETLFHELFSWHPGVPSLYLANSISRFMP